MSISGEIFKVRLGLKFEDKVPLIVWLAKEFTHCCDIVFMVKDEIEVLQ